MHGRLTLRDVFIKASNNSALRPAARGSNGLVLQVPVFRYALERWEPGAYEARAPGEVKIDSMANVEIEKGAGGTQFGVVLSTEAPTSIREADLVRADERSECAGDAGFTCAAGVEEKAAYWAISGVGAAGVW